MGETHENGHELTEEARTYVGNSARAYVERKLQRLEGRPITGKGAGIAPVDQLLNKPGKFEVKPARKYNTDADAVPAEAAAAAGTAFSKMEIDATPAAEDESDAEDSDEEMEDAGPTTNGSTSYENLSKKDIKALKTTDKKAYKKAKAAYKASKAAKKEKKKLKKDSKNDSKNSMKRKHHDDGEDKSSKKKKKKSKD